MLTKDTSSTAEKPRLMPMIDVAFLILIFFMALPMKTLDGKIETFLPERHGIGSHELDEPPPVPIRITIRKRGDGFIYRIGAHRFSSHYDLLGAFEELGPNRLYEIDGTPNLPQQAIMNVVDLLHGLNRQSMKLYKTKHNDVQFRGGLKLGRSVRTMSPLPKVD